MKKIIAISVMFALVAGAVFADVSMGGEFGYQMDFAKGTNGNTYPQGIKTKDKDDKDVADYIPLLGDTNGDKVFGYATPVKTSSEFKVAKVDFNFSGDNYGGRVRLYAAGSQGWWGAMSPFAFAWWKPVDVFKFQLGHNPDGDWGAAQITGWGFNQSAQDYVATDNDSGGSTSWIGPTWNTKSDSDPTLVGPFFGTKSRDRAWKAARAYGFYGGYSNVGALLSFYPVDIITINIALPVSNAQTGNGHASGTWETAQVFTNAHLNVVAKVGDIGTARLSFVGKGGTTTSKEYDEKTKAFVSSKSYGSTGDIFASFYLTMIENLGVDFGLGYHLPYDAPNGETGIALVTTKKNEGIDIGVGVRYTVSDDLGVKVRIGAKLLAEDKEVRFGGYSSKTRTNYGIGILPYYNLGGPTVYFNAGFGIDSYEEKSAGIGYSASRSYSYTDWYVNPYVKVPAGGLTFWAGVKLIGDTRLGHVTSTVTKIGTDYQNGGTMEWAIPIGINVSF